MMRVRLAKYALAVDVHVEQHQPLVIHVPRVATAALPPSNRSARDALVEACRRPQRGPSVHQSARGIRAAAERAVAAAERGPPRRLGAKRARRAHAVWSDLRRTACRGQAGRQGRKPTCPALPPRRVCSAASNAAAVGRPPEQRRPQEHIVLKSLRGTLRLLEEGLCVRDAGSAAVRHDAPHVVVLDGLQEREDARRAEGAQKLHVRLDGCRAGQQPRHAAAAAAIAVAAAAVGLRVCQSVEQRKLLFGAAVRRREQRRVLVGAGVPQQQRGGAPWACRNQRERMRQQRRLGCAAAPAAGAPAIRAAVQRRCKVAQRQVSAGRRPWKAKSPPKWCASASASTRGSPPPPPPPLTPLPSLPPPPPLSWRLSSPLVGCTKSDRASRPGSGPNEGSPSAPCSESLPPPPPPRPSLLPPPKVAATPSAKSSFMTASSRACASPRACAAATSPHGAAAAASTKCRSSRSPNEGRTLTRPHETNPTAKSSTERHAASDTPHPCKAACAPAAEAGGAAEGAQRERGLPSPPPLTSDKSALTSTCGTVWKCGVEAVEVWEARWVAGGREGAAGCTLADRRTFPPF
eukprot:365859-Chlamydomonas_euryale.AAC.7